MANLNLSAAEAYHEVRYDDTKWDAAWKMENDRRRLAFLGSRATRFLNYAKGTAIIALSVGVAVSMILLCWPDTGVEPVREAAVPSPGAVAIPPGAGIAGAATEPAVGSAVKPPVGPSTGGEIAWPEVKVDPKTGAITLSQVDPATGQRISHDAGTVSPPPPISETLGPVASRTIAAAQNETAADTVTNFTLFTSIPFNDDLGSDNRYTSVTSGHRYDKLSDVEPVSQWCYINVRGDGPLSGQIDIATKGLKDGVMVTKQTSDQDLSRAGLSDRDILKARSKCRFK